MGYDEGSLAKTGVGSIVVFGASVSLNWLLGVAVALVLVGAFSYRWANRCRKQRV